MGGRTWPVAGTQLHSVGVRNRDNPVRHTVCKSLQLDDRFVVTSCGGRISAMGRKPPVKASSSKQHQAVHRLRRTHHKINTVPADHDLVRRRLDP